MAFLKPSLITITNLRVCKDFIAPRISPLRLGCGSNCVVSRRSHGSEMFGCALSIMSFVRFQSKVLAFPKAAVHERSRRCDAASFKRTFEQMRSILTKPRSAERTELAYVGGAPKSGSANRAASIGFWSTYRRARETYQYQILSLNCCFWTDLLTKFLPPLRQFETLSAQRLDNYRSHLATSHRFVSFGTARISRSSGRLLRG